MRPDQTDTLLRRIANIDAANDLALPHEGHDDFRTFEGTAQVDDGAFVAAIHVVPDTGSVRLVLDPADADAMRRTVLDDGRVALDFGPTADEGATISISTPCPSCAADLVDALDGISDRLDGLLDGALCATPASAA